MTIHKFVALHTLEIACIQACKMFGELRMPRPSPRTKTEASHGRSGREREVVIASSTAHILSARVLRINQPYVPVAVSGLKGGGAPRGKARRSLSGISTEKPETRMNLNTTVGRRRPVRQSFVCHIVLEFALFLKARMGAGRI